MQNRLAKLRGYLVPIWRAAVLALLILIAMDQDELNDNMPSSCASFSDVSSHVDERLEDLERALIRRCDW